MAKAVLDGRPQEGSKGRNPGVRRVWEVLTRLVGFKAESIESECGSKDLARLFPRTKVPPGRYLSWLWLFSMAVSDK